MTETRQGKQLFTVSKVFFLLIVIPLLLMALLIGKGIIQLGQTAKERAVTVLDQKSQEEITVRATDIADEIADFLQERKRDMLIATIMPTTEKAYKEFVSENKLPLWVKKDDKITKVFEPLYTEMALIDKTGKEVIKIVDGEVVPGNNLANVSKPANTTYKSEDFFSQVKRLNKGEVYISHVTGWYVNRSEVEKGKRFQGIVRFATPLFDKLGFIGVVTLALDVRHLTKFTDNIIPTQPGYVLEADASTGNYAYMVDNRGFIISHPDDYHIVGLYKNGKQVPGLTEETLKEMTDRGEMALNLSLLGFMDPALPEITKEAALGNSGAKIYKFKGHTKFVAYSPIKFFSKDYPEPGGFGWIGMGVDVDKFNEVALTTSNKIEKEAEAWMTTIIVIIVFSVILLFLIAAILAKGVTRSIDADVPPGSEGGHRYEDED